MHIKQLIGQYLRHCSLEKNLQPTTTRCMSSCFNIFVRQTGITLLIQIDLSALREFFYDGKSRLFWSYNTHNNYYNYLRGLLNWCVSEKMITKNPILELKKPKKPQTLPRRLTYEEAQKILFTCWSYNWRYQFERSRNYAMMAVFLYSGIRCNELRNLKMSDINLIRGNLFVEKGKGAKDRNVPVHYKLKRMLQDYLVERTRLNKSSPFLFVGVQGNCQLSYKNILRMCKKLAASTGIYFTPHSLRHTFGSVSIEQGLDVVKLKEIMGHSDISSTMIYLKMSSKNLQESVDRLDLF
jgi:site-specific recombinase XerD